MAVPDAVCWGLSDEPSKDRLVTHTRLPVVPWRVRLPAPMPASWVAYLLLAAFAMSLVTFIGITSTGHSARVAVVAAAFAAWALGRCLRPFAEVRLRREAFAVLSVLYEDRPDSRDAGT
ncbi:hypothetical protein ET495_11555 [Xylanimonas allomyrinae]|uniref:Uncharacterized protein n=1 Tax=Xylanimonas allomyrinae TaxID=2509459 RepID=A0A4V0YEC9_9MICO|nr:hypothetical protein [Xylanimonas allomyrinae]QAY63771.1 hypothetical protein ET495_11555 [Xylanimonas allomyrinae]